MNYDFTEDWLSYHLPLFQRYLARFRGDPCRVLEIGTFEGRTTLWLVENIATHAEARVETIDCLPNERFNANLESSGWLRGRIIQHLGYSYKVLRELPLLSYDFIYVDGCHQQMHVMEDAVLAFRLLKIGGIMAFDDYEWSPWQQEDPIKPVLDSFLAAYRLDVEVLHKDYQLWIVKVMDRQTYV